MNRVLLDCDGVICNYASAWIDAYKKCGGDNITVSDLTDWDFEVCVPRARELRPYIQSYTHAPGFAQTLAPYPGAIEGVRRIMKVAEVVFVTAPLASRTWAHDRTLWLQGYFGEGCTIVSTEHKHLIHGNVLVDDRIHNVERWCDEWNGIEYLWRQPWNSDAKGFRRTNDWGEILEACK